MASSPDRIKAPLKILLLADDVVVAELENEALWEEVLLAIMSQARSAKVADQKASPRSD
jgi:hypothetical protein